MVITTFWPLNTYMHLHAESMVKLPCSCWCPVFMGIILRTIRVVWHRHRLQNCSTIQVKTLWCVYLYWHVCVHVQIIYIQTLGFYPGHQHTHAHIHIHMHVCVYVRIIYIYIIHICIYTCMYVYMCVCITHMCIYTCTNNIYIYTHMHIYTQRSVALWQRNMDYTEGHIHVSLLPCMCRMWGKAARHPS